MNTETINNIVNILGKFKDLKRSGWLMYKVKNPESDAEHSFGVAILAMMLAPEGLNKQRCLELALVHDLPEIYAGDITPFDGISKEDKHQREEKAAKQIANEIQLSKLTSLIDEYNTKDTLEARFVSLIDKIETAMSAKYYDQNKRTQRKLFDEFWEYAKNHSKQMNESELSDLQDFLDKLKL